MVLLIGIWLLGLVLFGVGVWLFSMKVDSVDSFAFVLCVVGIFFVTMVTFFAVPTKMPTGLPTRSVSVGEYKVAFVYQAGKNVNLGIEKRETSNERSPERIYLYQLPLSAFDNSQINKDAKKLSVVESPGGFKRLSLK